MAQILSTSGHIGFNANRPPEGDLTLFALEFGNLLPSPITVPSFKNLPQFAAFRLITMDSPHDNKTPFLADGGHIGFRAYRFWWLMAVCWWCFSYAFLLLNAVSLFYFKFFMTWPWRGVLTLKVTLNRKNNIRNGFLTPENMWKVVLHTKFPAVWHKSSPPAAILDLMQTFHQRATSLCLRWNLKTSYPYLSPCQVAKTCHNWQLSA